MRHLVIGVGALLLGSACFTPVPEDPGSNLQPQTCLVGTVTNLASPSDLNLFGEPMYFAGGDALEAGNYRIKNEGGCMKYGPGQNWTSNADASGAVGWWLIAGAPQNRLVIAPGTVGFERVPGSVDRDVGSYSDFAQCDAANRALDPMDFHFAGGKLGIWLRDDIYGDNSPGVGGKNPSWTLARVTSSCP